MSLICCSQGASVENLDQYIGIKDTCASIILYIAVCHHSLGRGVPDNPIAA